MFGIGGFEFFLIVLFAFLIFGPDKLPEVLKTANKALQKFRKAQQEVDSVIKTEVAKGQNLDTDNPLDIIDSAAKTVEKSQDSFAERKARYDSERAEAQSLESEQQTSEILDKPAPNSEETAETVVVEPAPKPNPVKAARTSGVIPSADELYGVRPAAAHVRKKAPVSDSEAKEG